MLVTKRSAIVERRQCIDHGCDLGVGQLGEARHADARAGPRLRLRALGSRQIPIGGLLGECERIVNGRRDAVGGETIAGGAAVPGAEHGEMVDVVGVVVLPTQSGAAVRRAAAIERRRSVAAASPGSDSRSQPASSSDRRKFCDRSTCTYCCVMPWTRSRRTVAASASSPVVTAPAVADAAEVLRRIERVRRRRAGSPGTERAVSLRGIVDDGQIGGGGLRRPTVEVNDDHRLRALRSMCFPCRRGDGGRARIDVDEDGRGPDRAHRRCGGHGRERGNEDLVARADAECVEDELERGRPRRTRRRRGRRRTKRPARFRGPRAPGRGGRDRRRAPAPRHRGTEPTSAAVRRLRSTTGTTGGDGRRRSCREHHLAA